MTDELKNRIEFRYNLSVYFNLMKKYKSLIFFIIILAVLIELRYLADKFLFKEIIDRGTDFIGGTLTSEAYLSILSVIGFIFIFLILMSFAMQWLKEHFIIKLEADMIFELKQKFFNHLIGLHHGFHVNHKTGSLISRLLRSGGAIERITDTLFYQFAPLIIEVAALTISLVYFDFTSALVVLAVVVTFISYSFFIQRIQESSNLMMNQAEDIEKANVSDFLTNMDSIKYFGKEKFVRDKFAKISENSKTTLIKNWNYFRWFGSVQNIILGGGTFLIVFFSVKGFMEGRITLGTLVFIFTAYVSLVPPMFNFVHGIRNFYRSLADFQDLFQYGKIENEIKDLASTKELEVKHGEIEFRNITFNYGKRKIFDNFNLKISKNKKVALVGHSGSGKTTLIKLLYRFYDVDKGEILIDNNNIKNFKQESLRSGMSIVPQECILFDDTIFNNVKFSNPKAIKEDVIKAIKFAQLDRIIDQLPKKENSIVGERGVKLSGGEKQRVSIARAILANKKILVLDEATSSLDSETEFEIQKDLEKLMQNRTAIIIAHRLSTIMKADLIVVLKNGKIVQTGKHSELIKQQGEYKRLWNLQRGGYIK